ncbi:MAG: VWA domain-containing protein [Planctomycetota bacterium]|nr:MAG: VWA domain-containing protein [Planctomycetota bacterium]
MKVKRMSIASLVATSGGCILACALMLSASLAVANPGRVVTGRTGTPSWGPGPRTFSGMDLPMAPASLGSAPMNASLDPTPAPAPQPPQEQPEDGEDPRDTPPPVFFGEEIDAETDSIVYVIDHSGSMSLSAEPFEDLDGSIRTGSRLDRAKAELKRSIASLPESFYFNVFFYDECVSGCWGKKQQASPGNKQAAFAWIDAIQPDGWTNTGLAMQTALYDKDNRTVVLLSDGSPNFIDCAMNYVGSFDTHKAMIRNENTQGATINTFGIGISSDNDARTFMQQVAVENGGSYTEIN